MFVLLFLSPKIIDFNMETLSKGNEIDLIELREELDGLYDRIFEELNPHADLSEVEVKELKNLHEDLKLKLESKAEDGLNLVVNKFREESESDVEAVYRSLHYLCVHLQGSVFIKRRFELKHSNIYGDSHNYTVNDYFKGRNDNYLYSLLDSPEGISYLENWSSYMALNVLPRLFEGIDCEIVNGGVKSSESLERILNQRKKANDEDFSLKNVRDLIRGRVVVENYSEVEKLIKRMNDCGLDHSIVKGVNTFLLMMNSWKSGFGKFRKPLLRGNFTLKIDDNLCYELQIMARNAIKFCKLDHPIKVSQTMKVDRNLEMYLDALHFYSNFVEMLKYDGQKDREIVLQASKNNPERDSGSFPVLFGYFKTSDSTTYIYYDEDLNF
ncbi:hypothetical protein A2229_02940 [Candidatus Peregrinibacteria bacterium RIFOXYA2_FULL_33_7]|nr:MAG: hypothetical protein A2229_02940 [Candidatus Peregrinibacteria bacterium RIFOXYA2_FULL_33_7]